MLLAAVDFNPCLLAQNYTARLDLQQSTDGLSSWQRVPMTAEMLNNGSVDLSVTSSSAFYRLKVEVVQKPTPTTTLISVTGGTLPTSSSLGNRIVASFRIEKYEVTWDEWQVVRAWAVVNGYSTLASGLGSAGNHPVRQVSWNDVVMWCNARSERDGLTPVYQVQVSQFSWSVYRGGSSVPTVNSSANGYRLPSEAEWEWAARGGLSSQGYTYSGSNDVNAVAWYSSNSGGGTKVVGTKAANELGIYDMSGSVAEWCWDIYDPLYAARCIRGGSWLYTMSQCAVAYRVRNSDPRNRDYDIGFRLARNAP